jgi:hypothetical protein
MISQLTKSLECRMGSAGAVETGGSQVKIVSHSHNIRIRIVGVNNGVAVSAVPQVGLPNLSVQQ